MDDEILRVRRVLGLPADARVPEINPCQYDRPDGTAPDVELELAANFARVVFGAEAPFDQAAAVEYVIRSRRMRERRRVEGW